MKSNGKRYNITGYHKNTVKYEYEIQLIERQIEIMTNKYLKGKMSDQEVTLYKKACELLSLAKTTTEEDDCGKYVRELNDIKEKFIYIDKKRKISIG